MATILHIITGLDDGGAEAALHRLCTHHSGVKHHVVSLMDEGKYGPSLRNASVTITCLNMPQGQVTPGGLWQLWRLLRRERPDIVQTWMYHANLIGGVLARLAGIRYVFWGIHHATLDAGYSKRSTITIARLCACISRWVPTAIVCCAQRSLEVHRELGYSTDKLVMIANGYDLSRFVINDDARTHLRKQWNVEGCWLLGMVGRFDPLKDHRNFLLALAELRYRGIDFCVVLIGRGLEDSNEQLMGWLEELKLQGDVRLLGQRTDIPDVMNALDLHVLSSSSEAFPNVVAEAMACGTPVVTTDVGDAAMMVSDTGWVVPPQDAPALTEALLAARTAMNAPQAWAARRAAARQRIEDNFSLSRMTANYDALWRTVNNDREFKGDEGRR